MCSLQAADYQKILEFSQYIHMDYSNFIENVLVAMSRYFGYRLVVYTIFNKNKRGEVFVENVYSNGVEPDLLSKYQDVLFSSDMFIQRLPYKRTVNQAQSFSIINDIATFEEFFNTDYGKHLQDMNLGYQAILHGKSVYPYPLHAINVFKSLGEGDFTPYEHLLFAQLGDVLEQAIKLMKQHNQLLLQTKLMNVCAESQQHGVLVVDSVGRCVYQNDLLRLAALQLADYHAASRAVEWLLQQIEDAAGIPLSQIRRDTQLALPGYRLDITTCKLHTGECWEQYRCLILSPAGQKLPDITQIKACLVERYRLSPRELAVAQLMLQGLDNAAIAHDLGFTVSTAKFHIKNIFHKLEVPNRLTAISKILGLA